MGAELMGTGCAWVMGELEEVNGGHRVSGRLCWIFPQSVNGGMGEKC